MPEQQEKSKIKISSPKIPILFMTDHVDSGFGTVGKNLISRLAEMEVFDCHYLGWHSTPEQKAKAQSDGYTLHNTKFWTGGADQFGMQSFDEIVGATNPKVVLTLGDPWMVDHIANSKYRESFMWVSYTPIDRDYISRSWRRVMRKCDVLALYSKFGMDVVEEQIPFKSPVLVLHGVDRMVFKPWYPEGMDENTQLDELMNKRKQITMGKLFDGKWVVGFVGRNQVRKAIPRAFRAFRAFNCSTWCDRQDVEILGDDGSIDESFKAEDFCKNVQKFRCDHCPAFQQREETLETILYMHTTTGDGSDPQDKPGIGWLMSELAERYKIRGRLAMTPSYTALKGLPRTALAQLMNCFDVHLFMSHSEGFGLPVVESLACGVPNLVTNYSSMPELIEKGGGKTIDVVDYDTYVTWENDWANADIGHAADLINELFTDKELYAQMRKAAAANNYAPNWDEVAMQFRDMILKCVM